jgi:hypothetical protein
MLVSERFDASQFPHALCAGVDLAPVPYDRRRQAGDAAFLNLFSEVTVNPRSQILPLCGSSADVDRRDEQQDQPVYGGKGHQLREYCKAHETCGLDNSGS